MAEKENVEKEKGLKIVFAGFILSVVGFGVAWCNMRSLGIFITVIGYLVGVVGIWRGKMGSKG